MAAACLRGARRDLAFFAALPYNMGITAEGGREVANAGITKKALAAAFKELLEERQFSEISIADICQQCHMSRKSFYYHFKDKYDLACWIVDEEFAVMLPPNDDADMWETMQEMAEYFYANRRFYRKMLRVSGQNSLAEHFYELARPRLAERLQKYLGDQPVPEFQLRFFSSGIVHAFQQWITDKDCIPPEELMAQLRVCVQCLAAYGREQGQL